MHVSQRTADGFKLEDINDPEDLFYFSADDLYSLFESMKKTVGSADNKGDYTADHPMHISTKSKRRVIVADNDTRYYTQVRRSITPDNMSWRTLANFDMQWQALLKQDKQDDPEVPKLGKNGSILKWINPSSYTPSLSSVFACAHCCTRLTMKQARRPQGQNSSRISHTRLIMVQSPRNLPPSHRIIILCTIKITVTCTAGLREH